jgi:hypothetical protein
VKFKEFHEVDICNLRSNIGYCFFFVPKNSTVSPPSLKDIFLYQRDTYDSNYSFASEENQHNMIYDFGDHIKKMRNAHLMADNSVGIELFEFEEPRMPKGERRGIRDFFIFA